MEVLKIVLRDCIYILACISVIQAEVVLTHSPDNVFENKPVTLTCQYTGTLDVQGYYWHRNSASVGTLVYDATSGCTPFIEPNTTLYTYSCPETNRVTLTILQVTQNNNGDEWTCSYLLTDSSRPTSNVYTFIVQVPVTSVTITEPTRTTVSIQENTDQVFKCRTSTSRPTAVIRWYLDDGTSSVDTRITDNVQQTPAANVNELKAVTGTLTYRPTRQVNGWQLYCSAQTVKSSTKVLSITYPPNSTKIDNYVKDSTYSMIAGKQQTLTCRSIDGNPLATISWSCFTGTNSDSVSGTTVTSVRTWTTNTGGQCRCISDHTHGTQRYSLNVVILVAVNDVNFHISNQEVAGNVKVIADSTVPIVCSASGSPTITYKWKQGTMEVTGNSLYPSNILQDGTYSCHASNTLTPTQGQPEPHSSSSSVDITRLYPSTPEIRYGDANGTVITEPLWVVQGHQFQLHCHAASSPASSYTWSRGNYENSILTISSSNDEQVTCTAKTVMAPTVGSSTTKNTPVTVSIKVLNVPDAPRNLIVLPGTVTETSAVIGWNPGFSGGPVQTFVVMIWKEGNTQWTVHYVNDTGADQQYFTITPLEPNTNYKVQVYAFNSAGNGALNWKTGAFKTLPGVTAQNSDGDMHLYAIIGASVGSVLGIVIIVIVTVFIVRRVRSRHHPNNGKLDSMPLEQTPRLPTSRTRNIDQDNDMVESEGQEITQYEEIQSRGNTIDNYSLLCQEEGLNDNSACVYINTTLRQ